MITYISHRILQGILAVWGVVTLVFFLARLSGNPVVLMVPPGTPKELVAELAHQLGLDRPLLVQYFSFLWDAVRGAFPDSLVFSRPSLEVALPHLKSTAILAIVSLIVAVSMGVLSGFFMAIFNGRALQAPLSFITMAGQAVPSFWLGEVLILVFAVGLHWFPVGGDTSLSSIVLPAITLGALTYAMVARMTRSTVIDAMNADYVKTAVMKGASRKRILASHVLPNAALPVLTVIGLQAGLLLGGAVITETIFSWPGIGRLMINAITRSDFPLVQTCVIIVSIIFVLVNLLTDVAYMLVDPRLRIR